MFGSRARTRLRNSVALLAASFVAVTISGAAAPPGNASEPSAQPLGPVLRTSPPPGEDRALVLLERAAKASRRVPYQGLQFVSTWSTSGATSVLVRIQHLPEHGTEVEVFDTATDRGHRTYESDSSYTDTTPAGLGGIGGAALGLLARNYRVSLEGKAKVAGRLVAIVKARRPDGSVAACFWLDRESGLMLRRQVYDRDGRVMRASSFVSLRFAKPRVPHGEAGDSRPWGAWLEAGDMTELRTHGWNIDKTLPGGLTLLEARRGSTTAGPVLHLTYSDGLSTVSVFEQKGDLDTESLDGWREVSYDGFTLYQRDTVPQRVVWASDGYVYTLLADAPPDVVEAAVGALPHEQGEGGFWGRMSRGLDRLASWLNPFALAAKL